MVEQRFVDQGLPANSWSHIHRVTRAVNTKILPVIYVTNSITPVYKPDFNTYHKSFNGMTNSYLDIIYSLQIHRNVSMHIRNKSN